MTSIREQRRIVVNVMLTFKTFNYETNVTSRFRLVMLVACSHMSVRDSRERVDPCMSNYRSVVSAVVIRLIKFFGGIGFIWAVVLQAWCNVCRVRVTGIDQGYITYLVPIVVRTTNNGFAYAMFTMDANFRYQVRYAREVFILVISINQDGIFIRLMRLATSVQAAN